MMQCKDIDFWHIITQSNCGESWFCQESIDNLVGQCWKERLVFVLHNLGWINELLTSDEQTDRQDKVWKPNDDGFGDCFCLSLSELP